MDGSKYKCFWKVGSAENVSTGFLKSMCIYLVWKAIVRLTDFQLHPLANCTTIWLVLTNKLQFTSFYFQFQFSLLNCMCSCRQSTFFSEATPLYFVSSSLLLACDCDTYILCINMKTYILYILKQLSWPLMMMINIWVSSDYFKSFRIIIHVNSHACES